MKITIWANTFDKIGEQVELSWGDFVERLRYPVEIAKKMDAPAWSGAAFSGPRSKSNCLGVCVEGLDYDNKEKIVTIDQAIQWWSGLSSVVHSTHSHTPERPRFRVIFQLSRLATVQEHAQVMEWLHSRAGGAVDPATRDPSRIWYLPSISPGGQYEFHAIEGSPLDVDSICAPSSGGGGGGGDSGIANPERYYQAAVDRAAAAFRAAPHGTRNNLVAREAYSLGGIIAEAGVHSSRAEADLLAAVQSAQWHPYDESHEIGTIRRQLAAGQLRPRVVNRRGGSLRSVKTPQEAAAGMARPARRVPEDWHRELIRTEQGAIIPNLANCAIILSRGAWEGALKYNTCENSIEIHGSPPGVRPGPRAWSTGDEQAAAIWLQREWNLTSVSPIRVFDAVTAIASANQYNPIKTWLESLSWDGTPRIHRWLTRYAGVVENEYTTAVGQAWLRSVAARGLTPGYKVDSILVFEGNQGIKKSSFFKILGGNFFVSLTTIVGDRAVQNMMGKLIVELAELEALDRAEISALKGQITREVDRIRLPWGRVAVDVPRTAVLAGSCNRNDYLRDDTGNRRFWPVVATQLDLDALQADRDQLLAEAIVQVRRGELTYLPPQVAALAGREADSRVMPDSWEDRLEDWLKTIRDESITISQVLDKIGVELPKQGRAEQQRAASILRKNGWASKQIMVNGERKNRWSWGGQK